MGRALLVLDTPADRQKAVHWIGKAPDGTRVEFKASKRSLPQNDLMWALLTEFAQQFEHAGKKYDATQWKSIFLHAFGREVSFLPSLDGRTFLPIEMSSSDLSKPEMTDFIEFIIKEAAERGIILTNPKEPESGDAPTPDATEPPSSVAEPAGALIPAGSSIPDISDSDGGPVSGDDPTGGENAPSQPPAGSRDHETEILIRFAKDVLPMAGNPDTAGPTLGSVEKRWASEIVKLSPERQEQAKAISRSMRAIFNGNTSLESAMEFYSEALGASIEELGG